MFSQSSPREKLVYLGIVCLLLAGAGFVGAQQLKRPAPIVYKPLPHPGETPTATVTNGTEIVVHVVGAVRNPGLVRLPEGSRVTDAVKAAGGASGEANLSGINLAAKLIDGTQLMVPGKTDEAPGPKLSAPNAQPARSYQGNPRTIAPYRIEPEAVSSVMKSENQTEPAKAVPGRISLNRATAEELERLPGIGPTMAARILEYRGIVGRFSSIDQLKEVKGIGEKKFEKLRDLIKL